MTEQTEIVSNCCGAEILMADSEGFGMCRECKEHCIAEEVEVLEEKENENDRPQR